MTIRHLKIFIAVVEYGTMHRRKVVFTKQQNSFLYPSRRLAKPFQNWSPIMELNFSKESLKDYIFQKKGATCFHMHNTQLMPFKKWMN